MTLSLPRRRPTQPAATDDQAPAKRKRRTLEDIYKLIDENLAILD